MMRPRFEAVAAWGACGMWHVACFAVLCLSAAMCRGCGKPWGPKAYTIVIPMVCRTRPCVVARKNALY